MRRAGLRGLMLLPLLLVLVGLIQPIATPLVVVADQQSLQQPVATGNTTRVYVKAVLVKNVIERILASVGEDQLPEDLLVKLRELASVNLTSLSPEELVEYVREARSAIQEFKRYAASRDIMSVRDIAKSILLERIKIAVELRIERLASKLNLTSSEVEELKAKIREATSIRELMELLKSIDRRLVVGLSIMFARHAGYMMNKTIAGLIEAKIRGDLDRAVKASWKVLAILNRTLERLRELNVSETAIEALERAIQHIMVSRDLVVDVIRGLGPAIKLPPEKIEEMLKGRHGALIERVIARTLASIESLMYELRVYSEILAAIASGNATVDASRAERLLVEIDQLLQKLSEYHEKISAGDVRSIMSAVNSIVEARKLLAKAKAITARAVVSGDNRIVDLLHDKIVEKLAGIEERIEALEGKIDSITNPHVKMKAQMLLEKARKNLQSIQDLVSQAESLATEGNYTDAVRLLQRSLTLLASLERLILQAEQLVAA